MDPIIKLASDAQDLGAAFSTFAEELSPSVSSADILAVTSKFYSISAHLRHLDTDIVSPEYGHNYDRIRDDLSLVRASLRRTLEDVFGMLAEVKSRELQGSSTRTAYYYTWKNITKCCMDETGISLLARLQKYDGFLGEIEEELRRRNQGSSPYAASYRSELNRILDLQMEADLTDGVALGSPGQQPRPRRSYERRRPQPNINTGPTSPISPTGPPPMVPELSSPTTTTTSTSSSTAPSSVSSVNSHWAKALVKVDSHSVTPLPHVGETSRFYGVDMPGAKDRLRMEYDEVFEMSLPGAEQMRCRFYLRPHDSRARLYCRSFSTQKGPIRSCLPLNCLEVHRDKACLKLCRRIPGEDALRLWACIRFSTMEKLVLFFCCFLALRSQDTSKTVSNIGDFELREEDEMYAGQIIDDNFLHGLRIFRDRHSRSVRLQASVLRGELINVPVWTAFITNNVTSPRWIKRMDSKTFHIREMQRFVFSNAYTPQRTGRGEHVLSFTTRDDANAFENVIEEVESLCMFN